MWGWGGGGGASLLCGVASPLVGGAGIGRARSGSPGVARLGLPAGGRPERRSGERRAGLAGPGSCGGPTVIVR